MIRGFLYFVLFLVAGAGIFQLVTQGSGYILIVWGQTSIEMSLWFSIVALLILLFLAWLIWSICSGSFKSLVKAKRTVFGYGDKKAQAQTVDGLIDYIEENWSQARKKLTRSANKAQAPIINFLAAARSAYEMGDEQSALELLHKAENSNQRGGLAVALFQTRMHLGNKQFEQALATLERASAINPEHQVVLELRKDTYLELKDWAALKDLLPQLKKNKIVTPEKYLQYEVTIHKEELKLLFENQSEISADDKQKSLKAFWKSIPTDIKRDESILSDCTSQLMAEGLHDEAEKILSSAIPLHWHGQWLDLYGLLLCSDSRKPLFTAEKWLVKQEKNPKLLLALGRLCVQNEQWGRAVDYFEKSISILPRPETFAELANVLDFIGENKKSDAYYKKGLLLSTSVLANKDVYSKAGNKSASI